MKTNHKMRATYMMFGFAVLLMNLSNVPGLNAEIGSTDLLSTAGCDVEGDIQVNGASTCNVEKNKVRGSFTITKVRKPVPEGAPATATAAEEFEVSSDLEAEFCADGSCRRVRRGVRSLAEALAAGKKLAEELLTDAAKKQREEKERLAKIAKCEMTEDGEPIVKEKHILKCLTDKLSGLTGEEAEDYYNDNLRERIQALLQSDVSGNRALGMEALQNVGKNQKINCAARPGMQQTNNPFLSQTNLAPVMNSMQPVNLAGTTRSADRNFIAESACDLWAFGTYNHNMDYLSFAAGQPGANRAALLQAKNQLQAGWAQYFNQRGLILKQNPLALGGYNSNLLDDVMENNARMDAAFKAIVDQHKEFMQPQQTTNVGDSTAATGRLARGGIVPQNPVGTGTPVNPWSSAPGAQQQPQQVPRPGLAPAQPGRFTGAPRMGAPVGPQSVAPMRR